MGFSSGFTGGVTLTLGIAYLTVLAHERNRQAQAQALRSQSRVLTGLLEPAPLPPPQSRAELAREDRVSLVETAKDRWNDEVENAVRWVQRTDWTEVREGMEGAVARLLGGGLQKSKEGIEEVEKIKVQEAVDRSKASFRKGVDDAAVGIDATAASTKEKLDHAGAKSAELRDAVKNKVDRAVSDAKSGVHDATNASRHSGGTIDAARGAMRDIVSTGIEKSKEAIGKAQAAVGIAAERIESKGQSAGLSHSSAVEKALHERYQKPDGLKKSEEAVLEERYQPIEARDNSVLRGL